MQRKKAEMGDGAASDRRERHGVRGSLFIPSISGYASRRGFRDIHCCFIIQPIFSWKLVKIHSILRDRSSNQMSLSKKRGIWGLTKLGNSRDESRYGGIQELKWHPWELSLFLLVHLLLGRFSHELEKVAPATPGWAETPGRQHPVPNSSVRLKS